MSTYKNLIDIIEEKQFSKKIYTSDTDAWLNNPDHQFIYNKLWIAQSQFINCAPMNIYPSNYPVIFKPIINLIGMSRGFRKINNKKEYDKYLKDGLFWEDYLEGDHYCIDLVLSKGNILFFSCLKSYPEKDGSFDYHESIPEYIFPEHLRFWISNFLEDYTGCLNIEVINGIIIEAHLRLNGDFHLYNTYFVSLISNLLEGNDVNFKSFKIKKLFLVPIFVDKKYTQISEENYINFFNKLGIQNIFFDDLTSRYQSEYLSRLLIFSHNHLQESLDIRTKFINFFL